jgi:hypothetical protein
MWKDWMNKNNNDFSDEGLLSIAGIGMISGVFG